MTAFGAFAIGRIRTSPMQASAAGPPLDSKEPKLPRRSSDPSSLAAGLAPNETAAGTLPSRPTDAVSERDQMLQQLQASGTDNSAWTTDARAVFTKWQSTSSAAINATIGDVVCFAKGCVTTMLFADRTSFKETSHDFQDSAAFRAWTGPKFRSAPIPQGSGLFEVTWVLSRADALIP